MGKLYWSHFEHNWMQLYKLLLTIHENGIKSVSSRACECFLRRVQYCASGSRT